MNRMKWANLLSPKRVRELKGGLESKFSDHREEFQRDYDRIVFSSPVRRLQDKAQVFPLEPIDAVRTRLTHSMEVSTLARGVALKIGELLGDHNGYKEHSLQIETISATVGLVHDLGNPPFGHFGEDAIAEWFQKSTLGKEAIAQFCDHPQLEQDFLRFEGNARTLRLLCNLQVLADRDGLNLTAATLSAATKYVADSSEAGSDEKDHTRSKPGFLFAEKDIVDLIRKETGTEDKRNPIAFIVEAADDCVYSLCDLEDAVKKGVLSWDELTGALHDAAEENKENPKDAVKVIEECIENAKKRIEERLELSGLSLGGKARDDAYVQMFRTIAASAIVEGASKAFVANYDEIMTGQFCGELVSAPKVGKAKGLVAACKEVGKKYVYCTRDTIELELRGRRVIHDLLDLLWIGIRDFEGEVPKPRELKGKAWNLLSENYRSVFLADWKQVTEIAKKHNLSEEALKQYFRLLLLVDYVAGMTDSFACSLHRSLNNG